MEIQLLHPQNSAAFKADVDPTTTGATCIRGLIDAGFLTPAPSGRPYSLMVSRTRTQILPSTTMQEAGVIPQDSLAVLQMEQGAHY